ncbi:MAG: VWA domain-containing protein, partial [Candidatus Eremiobacteraeota bacterium]|nr:VWA domain-containing protein [Candidatus Eremiobacteraeota bacterium]
MSVSNPLALVAALVAAALAAWLAVRAERARRREAFTYSSLPFLLDAARVSPWPGRIFAAAIVFAVLLGGAAFAGVRLVLPVASRDAAVAICLDTSGSMRATDVEPSREAAVRAAARSFIQSAPQGTRIAIVAFSSTAQQIAELGDDKESLLQALETVPPANGGTAIGDALALAGRILPP